MITQCMFDKILEILQSNIDATEIDIVKKVKTLLDSNFIESKLVTYDMKHYYSDGTLNIVLKLVYEDSEKTAVFTVNGSNIGFNLETSR